ncbi:hypothetical protein ARMSODRAFT_733770 [Armillaria solidipes]|uniref:Uncharacterized protein n=1 Tax=Armillaria solidipes TaxID=1076256 RepID=A0A2H3AN45_9AGAR|nr:hypothetical protein ARMSODRAFT_733770 [Armillaria solidipes]
MTSYDAMGIPSYSPTVDVTTLLRSWSSPDRIDKITMAHVRLDMIAVDSLVQPRLEHLKQLESEVSRLRAELDVISPMLDKYHSFHAPIRRLSPEVLLSIFSHLQPGPMPLKDDAPWVLTRVCSSWRDIVTHTSTLWSTIRMDCPLPLRPDLVCMSTLFTSSLRYSNNAPLDITLTSYQTIRATHRIAMLLTEHSIRWRSLVTGSDRFIPNDLPALEKLDLRMFSDLFYTLQAPRLHTLILSKLYGIPFSRFPSLRRLECSITHSAQLITLLAEAKQLTSLRVDCQEYSDPEMLPGSGVTSYLLELHLPNKVPEALLHISFPLLHSLTFGLPLCSPHDDEPGDIYILDNLHCPRLSTLILNDPTSFLSLKRLLSCPISRLDLVVGAQSVYYALNSTPLPHLEDLRITDKSPWGWWEMLKVIKMKKSLRNVEIKSVSPESIREVFRRENFPNELTISFSLCSGY